ICVAGSLLAGQGVETILPFSILRAGEPPREISTMDMNRITEKVQEALQLAQSEASRRSNQQIDVEHMLAALLAQEGGLAASILKRAGADVHLVSTRLNEELDR